MTDLTPKIAAERREAHVDLMTDGIAGDDMSIPFHVDLAESAYDALLSHFEQSGEKAVADAIRFGEQRNVRCLHIGCFHINYPTEKGASK